MNWIKIKVDYYSDNLEETKKSILETLKEIGITQFEMIDNFKVNKLDYDIVKRDNSVWSIIGYLINNRFAKKKIDIIVEELKNFLNVEDVVYEVYTSECMENEWNDKWKQYFLTTNITDSIIVKPSWEKKEDDESEKIIYIDPGMAFGTGTHETTKLCIMMIEKHHGHSSNMLDIGCGSGILMLVARKFGVKQTDGIDIDPNVTDVVIENMSNNNYIDNFEVWVGNLVDNVNKKYDLVVSNILVDILIVLLEDVEKILNDKAKIIFSGILKEKSEYFLEEAKKYNLHEIDRLEENEWISFTFLYEKR